MFLKDTLQETFIAITANKARSGLTVLGIVIGIASVIAMIAVGVGAQKSVEEQIQSIGSNLLMVRPGSQKGPGQVVSQGQGTAVSLDLEDVDAINKEIKNLSAVAPEITGNYQVIGNGNNTRTSIVGATFEYAKVKNVKVEKGSFISQIHTKNLAKVAVLGPDVSTELFGEQVNSIDKKIRINGIDFTVIGLVESKGSTGFNNSDDVVYIPISVARQYLSGSDAVSMVNVQVADADSMSKAEEDITALLLSRHKIKDPEDADFRVMNQADIIETASSITGTFTALLGAVAGISLVVGGIGIMNMMLTTVTERTREIGLRKAIGAKKSEISRQFLIEAVALTLLGGIIGIVLGWTVSLGMEKFFSISTEVSGYSILLAFGVSSLIGVVFGYYPARRASSLNPIEALRYE